MRALVLGGGGAKGMAHIGVLKALEEEGWRFDMVVGCSIGAIVGGLYALGYSTNLIERIAREIAADPTKEFLAPSFTLTEILDSEKFERFLRRYVGDFKIEEMPIKFAANAYDISTHREVVVRGGSLLAAMRVSASLPGIFEALNFKTTGMTLVDGGVVNPVPVKVARELGAEEVIAVNVLDRFPKGESFVRLPHFRRRKTLVSQVARFFAIRRKNPLKVLSESFIAYQGALVGAILEAHPPDVLIEPDTSGVGILDFTLENYEKLLKAGYRAAKEVLHRQSADT